MKRQHIIILILGNGYRIIVDIMTEKKCRQFMLLTWTLLIGQIVHQVRGKGIG